MKSLYLELPMVSFKYPASVYELAKKAGVPVREVAERDNVEPVGSVTSVQWRFDLVIQIIMITQDEEDSNRSIIDLTNGMSDIVNMNHRKLARKITKFLNDNQIKFTAVNGNTSEEYEDSEERAEMEGDD